MGIFVLCAVMAFRIAAKDHKIAEVDVCVVTADGATYQLCVCVCVARHHADMSVHTTDCFM